MKEPDQLVHTKIRRPFTRLSLVPRPRLQERITQGVQGPLTLVVAPAGFGKTTLVASSVVAGCGMPVAWLSLDKNDNQVDRFLKYVVTALQETDNRIGSEAAQLLAASQQALPETIMTSLINDLDIANKETILVLDDYHFISNQAVHKAVVFFLEHCPKTLHLVIATRSDPPLPLARLRARGQSVELRAADLSFTEPEAAQFLNEVMGLGLDVGSVAVLKERTEGWIAGLQMAALSMRDRHAVPAFIEAFSGTNRYILDYLLEEVLANQSPEIQRFLLCTSILERLTTPLCDAILEIREPRVESSDESLLSSLDSRSILEYLERANLFLVPLDDERRWYRYHHLFTDLLRARLVRSPYSQYQKSLHARASSWYEINGFPEEAIHHALAAGDYPEAARQIEAAAENAWLTGQYTSILAWTRALPNDLVYNRPWLCIWNAWVYTQIGITKDMNKWIEAAELCVGNDSQESLALTNEIASLKVFAVCFSHDYDRAIDLAEDVLKRPPLKHKKASEFIRCNILHLLGSMYFATGQILEAEKTCQETMELANRIGMLLRYFHATNKLMLIDKVTGHLVRANQKIEETQLFLRDQGYDNYFAAVQLYFRKIELLYEWNRLEEAQSLVDFLLKQERMIEVPYLRMDFYNIRSYLLLIKRDYVGAQNLLNQAMTIARQSYIWEGLAWRTEWLQIKLWLQEGDVSRAAAWISEQAKDSSDVISFSSEVPMVARARILLAQGACQESILLLDQLSDSADVGGRKGSLVEIRALKAIALQAEGKMDQAAAEIESVLALAKPEGYVRTFIDEGKPMQMLLAQWLAHAEPSPLRDYVVRLLSAFDAEPLVAALLQEKASLAGDPSARLRQSGQALIEPLSGRELEVLHLLALGSTNQEIAQQLIVSKGTVKAHTASIYRKLDVANRTEAVARARQLNILP